MAVALAACSNGPGGAKGETRPKSAESAPAAEPSESGTAYERAVRSLIAGSETGLHFASELTGNAGDNTLIGGGGVTLSGRNGVLASLRSSKDQGQSNFVNPGLALLGAGVDIEQIIVTLHERLDVPAFERALHDVVLRHDVLRTRFRFGDVDEPRQEVLARAEQTATVADWRDLAPDVWLTPRVAAGAMWRGARRQLAAALAESATKRETLEELGMREAWAARIQSLSVEAARRRRREGLAEAACDAASIGARVHLHAVFR